MDTTTTETPILRRIQNRFGIEGEILPGTGLKEYDIPERLHIRRMGYTFEFSEKLGSSWYLSSGQGIRIFTIGIKSNLYSSWYDKQYKYLDVTCDDDLLWEWIDSKIKDIINPNSCCKLVTDIVISNVLFDDLRKKWKDICYSYKSVINKAFPSHKHGMFRCPSIIYHYDDMFDEKFDMQVIDMKLPILTPDQPVKSIILQVRSNGTMWITTRELTQGEPPLLINIEKEVEVKSVDEIKDKMEELYGEYVKEWCTT